MYFSEYNILLEISTDINISSYGECHVRLDVVKANNNKENINNDYHMEYNISMYYAYVLLYLKKRNFISGVFC